MRILSFRDGANHGALWTKGHTMGTTTDTRAQAIITYGTRCRELAEARTHYRHTRHEFSDASHADQASARVRLDRAVAAHDAAALAAGIEVAS